MRIKTFEISSYRSCKKTKILMHEHLTGLIGINGAGKSNILNAILLLKKITHSRNNPRSDYEFSNQCHISLEIDHEGKSIYIRGPIIFSNDDRNNDEVQFSMLKWNFKEFTGVSKWFEFPIEFNPLLDMPHQHILPYTDQQIFQYEKQFYSRAYRKQPKLESQLIPKVAQFFYGINYYSASQFSDPSRCPVSIELEENRSVRRFRANSTHDQFILDLYRSYKSKSKQYKRYLSTINKEGIGLVDEINFTEVPLPSSSYVVRAGGSIKQTESNRLLVVPSIIIDKTNLSPNQLSEGTFKTLALLFYVLTDESKLLLIEEPEVCIHHGLLNSIIALIKSQSLKKQIIISTHSDFVLEHLAPENIILVKRDIVTGTNAKSLNKSMSRNDFLALRKYLEESGNLGEYWKEGGFDND